MNNRTRQTSRSLVRTLALAVPTFLIAMALFSPAEAKHKHKNKQMHKHHHHKIVYAPQPAPAVVRAHRHPQRYQGFIVPRFIGHRIHADFRSYFVGRSYSPAHRHYHQVYSFPQPTRGGYSFQPHYYCQGRLLFVDDRRPRGFVSFRFDF